MTTTTTTTTTLDSLNIDSADRDGILRAAQVYAARIKNRDTMLRLGMEDHEIAEATRLMVHAATEVPACIGSRVRDSYHAYLVTTEILALVPSMIDTVDLDRVL